MSKTLSNEDYFKASQELNCEPEALMACADNESSGAGFENGGNIVIRFEGHVFRKYTQGKFDKSHPEVSYSYANRHGKTHSHSAFNIAFGLDPVAALMATSWGKFQPMGFTFDECGFDDVNSYVDFLKESEGNELICFVRLIKHRHLADELQRHDWLGFAKVYNGADQASNGYDVKMGAAYKRHKAQKIDWSQFGKVSAVVPTVIQPVVSDSSPLPLDSATQPPEVSEQGENEAGVQQTANTPDSNNTPPPAEESKPPINDKQTLTKESPSTFVRWLVGIKATIGAILTGLGAWLTNNTIGQSLAQKSLDNVNGEIVYYLFLSLLGGVLITAIGIGAMFIAAFIWDRAASRSNMLNQQKLAIASQPGLITTELKKEGN